MLKYLLDKVDHALHLVVTLFFLLLLKVIESLPEINLEWLGSETEWMRLVVQLNTFLGHFNIFIEDVSNLEVYELFTGLALLNEILEFE